MKKKDIKRYGRLTAIVRERITSRTVRIEVIYPRGACLFEYEDSSERRDQLRNAFMLAQRMLDNGVVAKIMDEVTDPAVPRRVTVQNGNVEEVP